MSRKNPTFLVKQPNGYCFRINVPADLRRVVDLKEIRYSLQTKDYLKARSSALSLGLKIRRFFSELRSRRQYLSQLSPKDLKRLIKSFFLEERQKATDEMLLSPDIAPWDRAKRKSTHPDNFFHYWNAYQNRQLSLVSDQAQTFLKKNGLDLPEDSIEFKRFCHEMIRAKSLVYSISNDLEDGLYGTEKDHDIYFHETYLSEPPEVVQVAPVVPVDDSPLLSDSIDGFIKEKVSAKSWRENYHKEMLACLNVFKEFVKEDIHTSQINSKLTVSFKEALMRIPANKNKIKAYRNKSIHELLAMEIEKPMAANTVDKYLTRLGSYYGWAAAHGHIPANYAKDIKLKPTKRDDEERKAFSPADMRRIFNGPEYQNNSFKHPYQFWTPFFAAYAGLRADEIGQLYLEDIYKVDGIWVVDVNDNGPDKKLKTNTHSKRIVPLHPIFTEKGLPEYVETLRAQGQKRLFPEINKGVKGYGETISRAFNGNGNRIGLLKKWGVKGPHDKGTKVFHSFRHTFETHLEEQGVSPVHIVRLMGNKTGYESLDRYNKSALIERLYKEAILRINHITM